MIKKLSLFLLLCVLHIAQASVEVYFSPQDHIKNKLITRIRNERAAIKAALYLILDHDVVKELIKAHKRGVRVELVVDRGNLDSEWNKIPLLADAGIPVYIYKEKQGILHDKFFIFESNQGQSVVWTGSFNITYSADKYNKENVIVVDDLKTISQYSHEFEKLKRKGQFCRPSGQFTAYEAPGFNKSTFRNTRRF